MHSGGIAWRYRRKKDVIACGKMRHARELAMSICPPDITKWGNPLRKGMTIHIDIRGEVGERRDETETSISYRTREGIRNTYHEFE